MGNMPWGPGQDRGPGPGWILIVTFECLDVAGSGSFCALVLGPARVAVSPPLTTWHRGQNFMPRCEEYYRILTRDNHSTLLSVLIV